MAGGDTQVGGPRCRLSSGCEMPYVGLGTWQSDKGLVEEAVKVAIDAGYRHIDAAYVYGNEAEVGSGLQAKIADGTVKREEVFVTSKLWNTFHKKENVLPALKQSLQNLQLEYLDLFLIHWPVQFKFEGFALVPSSLFPKNPETGSVYEDQVDLLETWHAMEECVELGLARSIGVSNFNSKQLARILEGARKVKPSVNQIESHIFFQQCKLVDFCRGHGVLVTCYSPLGNPARPASMKSEDHPVVMEDPTILRIAGTRGKTPAQVALRFQLQRGLSVIPKSTTPLRVQENFAILDWELSPDEMAELSTVDRNLRFCIPMIDMPDGTKVPRDRQMHEFPFLEEF